MKPILIALVALVFAACGGKQTTAPAEHDKSASTGKQGDVCALGREHEGSAVAVACGPGFNCCYPCGIDGCDSVCMAGECPTDIP